MPAAWAVFWRTFLVQALWNYHSLIGAGFAWILLPTLRLTFAGRPERFEAAVARHAGLFNSHPYLVPLAASAVARLEHDGADPQVIERFKAAIRGPLGAIGDALVWQVWRPATALLAVVLILAGVPWWAAVAFFLIAYNSLHLAIRRWGIRQGWQSGTAIAAEIRSAPWTRVRTPAARALALLFGVAAVLLADRFAGRAADWVVFASAALLGSRLGPHVERFMLPAVGIAWFVLVAVAFSS